MQITKYIVGLSLLILTTFLISPSKAETCTTNDLGDRTCTTTTAGTTTGNVLTNSTFGTGSTYSTQDWTISGDVGHGHNGAPGTTYTGQNTSGGVLAFEGNPTGKIYQDVDLVGDGKLTQAQINEGFTSTMSADIWFWNNTENTFTLKQTITAGDGTVTTQTRNINDYDPNRSMNSGQWTNYTDSYTEASNTQTDFTIRAEVYNDTAGTSYDGAHYGPDVDNVQLSITTAGVQSTTITPCSELGTCTAAGNDIADAVDLTTDDGVDLFQDLDTKVDDAIKNFEQIEVVSIDTTMLIEDDLGQIEEVKFEEFVEMQFTSFIAENNLEETFKEELKVEGISEEQFFEEATNMVMEEMKEEFGSAVSFIEEEPVQEIKEEQIEEINNEPTLTEEVKEEEPTETLMSEPKEEINETESTTTETMEETPNETNETGETSENVSTESNVAEDKETENETETESNEEGVESEETGDVKSDIRTKTRIVGIEQKVQKVIEKVMAKLKKVDQQLAAIQLIKTKGISAGGADLTGYINKKVYNNQKQLEEISFYSSVNILEQSQIYGDKSLVKYTSNDPILQQQVALVNVQSEINTLRSEIYALKESLK